MAKNDRTYMENETLENVRLIFRNFAGKEGKFNREGDRSFAVVLSDEQAANLEGKGWPVKYLRPREEEDQPQPYISVTVKYSERSRPPRVILITSRGKNALDKDTIAQLDYAEIENVDLIIRPYEWVVNDASGVKAYLYSIYVTIREDALDRKYSDVDPASGSYVPDYDPEDDRY